MTNYNERLDKILKRVVAESIQISSQQGEISSKDYEDYLRDIKSDAKQALTSLNKELVADAKPLYFASPDKSEYQDGFNTCISFYEQNLLKALEEV